MREECAEEGTCREGGLGWRISGLGSTVTPVPCTYPMYGALKMCQD